MVAHVPQPTRTMDALVSDAVDDVDGAVAQLQPLTVEQERHHGEKVSAEQASVSGRKAHRGSTKKGACLKKGSAYQAKRWTTRAGVSSFFLLFWRRRVSDPPSRH